jgi:putative flippase GtrA
MIHRLFRAPSGGIPVQIFRYSLAGAAACAADYTVLITLTQSVKLHYLFSAAIAFTLGAFISYALSVRWVFDSKAFENKAAEISLFFSISLAGLFVNHYCILFFTETVKLYYLGSKAISTLTVSAMNFSARKYLLFRQRA